MSGQRENSPVEVKPEVVFLYEILQEFSRERIRIPRFQRPFVWRPDQMTDLLDSINRQYPIGSLLIWETDVAISTLDRLGPFVPTGASAGSIGYLLDGHQRLMTLASALLDGSAGLARSVEPVDGRWDMYWNYRTHRFQHRLRDEDSECLFPMTSLLDTAKFFDAIDGIKTVHGREASPIIEELSALARTFQSYRIPIIRLRETGLSEAVEIFARLNSKGQSMSPDQMVSALSFAQEDGESTFDLTSEIDGMVEMLGAVGFGEVDRSTVLRAILASLDENIYKTDWTRMAADRVTDIRERLGDGVERTRGSLSLAVDFLVAIGIPSSRVLPYGLQLVVLSAFFDREPSPSESQREVLERWFWVSSFSAWFGGANPSRIKNLLDEVRNDFAADRKASGLMSFDLEAESLPYPLNFDMRSARARTLLAVMLANDPKEGGESYREFAVRDLSANGPGSFGAVFSRLPKSCRGNPANRLLRPPGAGRGPLLAWIESRMAEGDVEALESCGISVDAAQTALRGDVLAFVAARQASLVEMERAFQLARNVTPSRTDAAPVSIDTE